MLRWSVAVPAMIARNNGIHDSLVESWELTGQDFWFIVKAYIPVFSPWAFGLACVFFFESTPVVVAAELAITIAIIIHWFVQLQLFIHLTQARLDEA